MVEIAAHLTSTRRAQVIEAETGPTKIVIRRTTTL